MEHFCGDLCGCKSFQDTLDRIVTMFIRWGLSKRPEKPELSEFSAVARCLKAFAWPLNMNEILFDAFLIAVGEFKVKNNPYLSNVPAADLKKEGRDVETHEFVENISWHKKQGARVKAIKTNLCNPFGKYSTNLMSFINVGCESITEFHTAEHEKPVLYSLVDFAKSPCP